MSCLVHALKIRVHTQKTREQLMKSPQEIAAAIQANIKANVDEHGLSIVHVMSDGENPSFAYTVGFTALGHPELIVFGLPPKYSQGMFNQYFKETTEGTRVPEVGLLTKVFNLPIYVVDAKPELSSEYTIQAEAFYKKPIKCRQVVLCDRNGKFAWDEDFDNHFTQPLLGAPN